MYSNQINGGQRLFWTMFNAISYVTFNRGILDFVRLWGTRWGSDFSEELNVCMYTLYPRFLGALQVAQTVEHWREPLKTLCSNVDWSIIRLLREIGLHRWHNSRDFDISFSRSCGPYFTGSSLEMNSGRQPCIRLTFIGRRTSASVILIHTYIFVYWRTGCHTVTL